MFGGLWMSNPQINKTLWRDHLTLQRVPNPDSSHCGDSVIITEQQETAQSSKLPVFIKVGEKELREWEKRNVADVTLLGASFYGACLSVHCSQSGQTSSLAVPVTSFIHFFALTLELWGTCLLRRISVPCVCVQMKIVKCTWTAANYCPVLWDYLCYCLDLRCVWLWWTSWVPIQIPTCTVLRGQRFYRCCVFSGFAPWPGVSKGVRAVWDRREDPVGHIHPWGGGPKPLFSNYPCRFFFHIIERKWVLFS